jgi:hypothetical protein
MTIAISEEQKQLLIATYIKKSQKIKELIQEVGLHYITEGSDKFGVSPIIRGEDLYDIVMDSEKCDNLINKLREYRLKAFK